jgi:Ca2+-binding RTX toxin-like protein
VGAGSFADADRANDIVNGGDGSDDVIGGWGKDRLSGGGGADRVIDTECDGPTTLTGGAGNDYFESWWSSFYGNICDQVSDKVNGGGGTDTAKVDRRDSVVYVERLTRITRLP